VLQGEGVHGMMGFWSRLVGSDEPPPQEDEVEDSSPPPAAAPEGTPEELEARKALKKKMLGKDDSEDDMWATIAKDKILEAKTIEHMFDTALEFIDDEWLADIDELPGNIYRIAALGTLTEGLFHDADPSITLMKLVRIFGFVSIFLVQLFGPPLLVASVFTGWGTDRGDDGEQFIHWASWEASTIDVQTLTTTKLLSCLFLFVFQLNGLYVLIQEKQSWVKIHKTFRYLKHNTPNMDVRGGHFLIIGACTNSWVVIMTSIASFTVLGASFSPRSLLFDALGLLFLYNLDDIDSALGFVSEDDWDGVRLGWIYREMVAVNYHTTHGNQTVSGRLMADKFIPEQEDWHGYLVAKVYDFVAAFLVVASIVLPVLGFLTPFSREGFMPEDWE
jgi:hypothetical protein